jgi:methionyl-tRNA synthetase|tara:strand:+ start:101 stop:1516 length:1416 start_codon:yes stop_codon:yes gene_type:complete
MAKKFYITTTIPYANAPPHIGHALEFVQADVLARWNRLKGNKVFYLTGTDEHGVKNYQTAKKEKLDPQKFVDRNSRYYLELCKELDISYDYFIRTTDKKKHWPGVIDMWKRLEKKGDIYKKKYSGNYCSGCERFVTDKDLVNGKCLDHPTLKIQKISEENYFFKLSKYSSKIKKLIKEDKLKLSPVQWKNDFLGLIKDGLQDVSFSRSKEVLPWGIPVPGDESQVMYVWPDALSNYLTGIGFPDKKYEKYWPADYHVVGKDMLRFHAGIWPGMLLSAGIALPKEIPVHGFLTVDGRKMSKSTGNVIAPLKLLEKYDSDSLRYSLCRSFVFGQDGDFSEKDLVARHNGELANKLGNLVSRVSGLIEKNGTSKGNVKLLKKLNEKQIVNLIECFEFDKALNEIFAFIDTCNEYVQDKKPWETKDKKILYELKESILKISELLWPFIPETSEKITKQFSAKKIKKGKILFKKIK